MFFSKPKNPRPKPHPIRDSLFLALMIVIGALAGRVYLVEAYAIPSGSMAPTLLGAHRHAVCPQCGHAFEVEATDGNPDLHCPLCHARFPMPGPVLSGDRLLVSKFPARPDRFDVMVFRNPQANDPLSAAPGPNGFFIKRVVGLPGERLHLLDGHVFIQKPGEKEFHIARRTDPGENPRWAEIARAAWRPVAVAPHPPAHWSFDFEAADADRRAAYDDATLHPYNQPRQGMLHRATETVTDLRLQARSDGGDGELAFSTTFAQAKRLSLAFAADGRLRLLGGNRVLGEAQLPAGRPATLELWLIDHEALAFADGRCLLRHPFDVPWAQLLAAPAPPPYPATIEANGRLTDLALFSAIPYLAEAGGDWGRGGLIRDDAGRIIPADPVVLPDGSGQPQACWFCLGDNSPASTDGRFWRDICPAVQARLLGGHAFAGLVPEGLLVGRAMGVIWPANDDGARWKPALSKIRKVR